MTQTFIQVERKQAKSWLRVLNYCRENLFLKDYVEHIDDASRAIKQAIAAPAAQQDTGLQALNKMLADYVKQIHAAQRQPLPAHEIVTMYEENPTSDSDMIAFARAIEAAHGIGEKK